MCLTCEAKDKHIESLEKQLDFFRGQLAPRPTFSPTGNLPSATTPVPTMESLPWVSEEEEELLAMKQAGLLEGVSVSEALEQIGAYSTEVYVEP